MMTTVQYANRAQRRFLSLYASGSDEEAVRWGRVVDALFAGNGDEASRRCLEEGFDEEAVEITKIFSSAS